MKNDFGIAVTQLCAERNLSKEVVLEALEAALISAYKRNFGTSQDIIVKIDPETGEACVYAEKAVVEEVEDELTQISLDEAGRHDAGVKLGDMARFEMTPGNFGRIAAQTAKQVILQRIREAERDSLYAAYADREGEIINGSVRSISSQAVTLNLGKAEALLPRSEQIPTERYHINQRIRVYILEVQRSSRGPQIIVSRSHRRFLYRLLELEVPEIFNGAVEVKAIAREAGFRSKVAVAALQQGIDPVGSCVGMRGVRIQNINTELNGEKIDIIEWDLDPAVFIANALSPATVHAVQINPAERVARVIVPDRQLSLAIGKEGQNARLAAKLAGWRIDIRSLTEAREDAARRAHEEALKRMEVEAGALEMEMAVAEAQQSAFAEVIGWTSPVEEEAPEELEVAVAAQEEVPVEMMPAETGAEIPEPEVEEALLAASEKELEPLPEPALESGSLFEGEWLVFQDEPVEEEGEQQLLASKQKKKQRKRTLVYDEELGEVVSRRRRKPGRSVDWDVEDVDY